jgi:hypothetical protein
VTGLEALGAGVVGAVVVAEGFGVALALAVALAFAVALAVAVGAVLAAALGADVVAACGRVPNCWELLLLVRLLVVEVAAADGLALAVAVAASTLLAGKSVERPMSFPVNRLAARTPM